MNSKKNVKANEKINFYFSSTKRSTEEVSVTDFLAKRLRLELENPNQVTTLNQRIQPDSTDHTECDRKIKLLEMQIVQLNEKIGDLENKNKILTKDCKNLKRLFDDSNKINMYKDMQINKILSATPGNSNATAPDQLVMFHSFEGVFTKTELTDLRSVNIRSTNDSTFIKDCLRMMYKNDLLKLEFRTAEFAVDGKQPMSEKKKKIITQMYTERLSYVPKDEFPWRLKKLNEHIKSGIRNIVRSKAFQQQQHQ